MKSPRQERGSQISGPLLFRALKTALPRELSVGRVSGTRATDAPRIGESYARRPDCGERAARSQWFRSTDAGSRSVPRRTTSLRASL